MNLQTFTRTAADMVRANDEARMARIDALVNAYIRTAAAR